LISLKEKVSDQFDFLSNLQPSLGFVVQNSYTNKISLIWRYMYAVTASCKASYSRLCMNWLRNIKCVEVVCKKIMQYSLLLWFLGMAKPGFVDSINSIAEHLNILWFPGLTFKLVVVSRPHFQACSGAESCIYSWFGISNCLNKWNSETKKLWVKKHRSFPAKEVFAAKIIWTYFGPKLVSLEWRCPFSDSF